MSVLRQNVFQAAAVVFSDVSFVASCSQFADLSQYIHFYLTIARAVAATVTVKACS